MVRHGAAAHRRAAPRCAMRSDGENHCIRSAGRAS
jgi:hypothetical protein